MHRLSPYDFANFEGLHKLEYRYQSMFQQLPPNDWEEALLPLKEVREQPIGDASEHFYFVFSAIDSLLLHLIRHKSRYTSR